MRRLCIRRAKVLIFFIACMAMLPKHLFLLEASSLYAAVRPAALSTFVSIKERGDWSDPTSWSVDGGVNVFRIPGILDEVIVQAGDTIIVDANDAEANTLELQGVLEMDDFYSGHDFGTMSGGGTLILQGTMPTYEASSTFFYTGRVVYDGSGNYTLPSSISQYHDLIVRGNGTRSISSDLIITQHLYIEDGAVLDAGSYDLNVQGDLYNTTGTTGLLSTGTITFDNTFSAQTIEGATVFQDLVVDKDVQILTIRDGIVSSGDFQINSGIVDSGEATVTVGDDWINDGIYLGTGTVVFNGNNVTHDIGGASATTFGSLEIDGTNNTFNYNGQVGLLFNLTVSSGVFRASSSITLSVPGDVVIGDDGILDATSISSLLVGGNWTKAESGNFAPGLGTVAFNGSAQTLLGETTFYGLEKLGGGTLDIVDSCTVTNTLTLTNGNINTPSVEGLVLGSSATVVGGSANSYLTGPLVQVARVPTAGAEEKRFPFGSDGTYRPVTLYTDLSGTGNDVYYRGELHEGPPSNRIVPEAIDHVSQLRYYSINQSARLPDPFAVAATVQVEYNADDEVDTPSELRLVKSDGSGNWIDIGGIGSGITGSITSDTFSSFSDFALGSSTENNPLPVELLTLTARAQEKSIYLRWATASETDNSHFVVERATDGEHFTPVITVPGAGTSEQEQWYEAWDHQPLSGKVYYRLQQVDFNGERAYSRPVSVDLSGLHRVRMTVYPNPTHGKTSLMIQELAVEKDCQVQLISPRGELLQASYVRTPINSPLLVDLGEVGHYPPGAYTVVVRSKNFYWSEKLLID